MALSDDIRNAAQKLTGKAKEETGKATGDRGLQAEGVIDQVAAKAKQAAADVADAVRDATQRRDDERR